MKFSEELNNYFNLLDCTTKDICKISGLSPTLLSRYLNDKRTPRIESKYFEKIVDSIYIIASQKNINLSKEEVLSTLKQSILSSNIDYDVFVNNFNTLLSELKINFSDLAASINYDTSFISRIKSKDRKPSDLENFIDKLSNYIVQNYSKEDKLELISSLLNCTLKELNNKDKYKEIFIKWITSSHEENKELVKSFLTKLDTFNLNDYIGTDFTKVKVPTSPVTLRSSKTYYDIEGRKQAEANFLKTTLLSKSNESIFYYSDLPISDAAKDEDFKKKWILAITMVLKKGLHLNMIHDVHRPINEMLLGLESWIPIYMTGSISPYYFKEHPSNLFLGSHCTSGSCALTSEYIKSKKSNSRFYFTTKKEELDYYKEKSQYLLSKAKPLMKIFKEEDKKEFKNFLNDTENKEYKVIVKNGFKNIDFYLNSKKWVIINKKTKPEIHFVIYNEKLKNAIETFLS